MKDISLLDSLIENNSINIGETASTWEEAVKKTFKPLLENKAVSKSYVESVISLTKKHGPYYIISDDIAMPHARPEDGAIKNAFSLVILKTPVLFEHDDRKVSVLIGLSATSSDIHVSSALPQVVATFEDPKTVDKIKNAKSIKEVKEILSKVDSSKYLNK